MKIQKLVLGSYQTNCYVISHNDIAIVIDPGANGEVILNRLSKENLKLEAIFLTHGHFDHIGAVDELYEQTKCKIYVHKNEETLLLNDEVDTKDELPRIFLKSPITFFEGDFNEFIIAKDITLDAIHTPGHSEGSVVYVLRNYERIFSGDTLFKESIGRVDFPFSNKRDMKESLKLLATFKDSCKVFPGHGEETTIGYEKENNMYF